MRVLGTCARPILIPIISAAMIFAAYCMSEAHDTLWTANYGGFYNETGQSMLRLSNGDMIIVGSTYSYGAGDYDIYLIRTDSTGIAIWEETYGGAGIDIGSDIMQSSDGNIIIVGSTTSVGNGNKDMYVLKVDTDGSLIWSKTFGGAGIDEAHAVGETSDNGLVICGTTTSYGAGGSDFYLVRTDAAGDSLWTATYGGAAGESGQDIDIASDGGFIMVGHTGTYGTGYSSIYLVRTDSAGDTLWTSTYGNDRADLGYAVAVTNDNGCILAGATAPDGANYYDAYVAKTDSLGVVQWDSTYGAAYEDRAYTVKPTSDGGYIVGGTTESSAGNDIDMYVIKLDPAGSVEWDSTYGGSESDFCRSIVIDPQNNYLMAGYSYSYTKGGSDVYVLKIEGEAATPVDGDEPVLPTDIVELKQNYPNPFNPSTTIEFNLPRSSRYSLLVYNVLGQQVRRWDEDHALAGWHGITWDGRDNDGNIVASGIYFYRLTTDMYNETRKMILMK